jgi:ribulose-5-phosphate 4-epimerase/fuculose-1-phosphate aldolase
MLDTAVPNSPGAQPSLLPANGPSWVLPEPGNTIDEIRLFRKQRLAAGLRLFAQYGFDYGPAGHITVRDPERSDHFWINPLGVYFGHVRVSDLLLVDHHGTVVQGNKPVNLAGFQIHSAIHKARPEIVGVAHSHSTYGTAWSTLGRMLDPLTQDSAAFYGLQALSTFTGIVLHADQADRLAQDMGSKNYAILQNHGLLTAGLSVESAVWSFIAFEKAAQIQLLAEAAVTKPIILSHEVASDIADGNSRVPDGSRYAFQPLYERIIREQPDLLD